MTNNYNFIKGIKEFTNELISYRTGFLVGSPFMLSTVSGEFIRTIEDYKDLSKVQKAGAITSLTLGGATGLAAIIAAIYTIEYFDLQGLMYPLAGATNLISAISEVKKKVKKDKEESKGLEEIAKYKDLSK